MTRPVLVIGLACLAISSCKPAAPSAGGERPLALREMSREQRHIFLKGYAGDWRGETDRSKGIPAPAIEKPFPPDARLIPLARPDPTRIGTMPLAQTINQRRSRRSYTAEALTIEELSFLLWSTQGIAGTDKAPNGRIVNQFRTVPSGGARHPFETYLAVNRVAGVEPGLYRYLPVEHQLLRIGDAIPPAVLAAACYGQEHAGRAAVLFIWSAIPYRTEWAYDYVAPKLIAIDAGHVCENLYLAAEAIGAGACAILGYHQQKLDKLIQVDGIEEFAFYLASVGKVGGEDPTTAQETEPRSQEGP